VPANEPAGTADERAMCGIVGADARPNGKSSRGGHGGEGRCLERHAGRGFGYNLNFATKQARHIWGGAARPYKRGGDLSSMTFGRPEELMIHTIALLARFIIAALVCTLSAVSPASAERRVARVIGNSAYQHTPAIDNPRNDASLMAETLRGLGFALVGNGAQVDLDEAAFDDILEKSATRWSGPT
jgi:Caspase domain